MKVIAQLFTPTRYLYVQASTLDKVIVDFILPAICSALVVTLHTLSPDLLRLSGETGLIAGIGSFMQVLVGFYVAALAAVATFPGSSLDEDAKNLKLSGEAIKRRKFLALLFGYLSLVSLGLFLSMLFRGVPEGAVSVLASWSSYRLDELAKAAFLFCFQFFFWQMILITLLGIHYLTDRIHRTDGY
jgi:hypothetical protein